MGVIGMKKCMGKNSIPFIFVIINPPGVKHVFGKESPVPEAHQGENYSESKDIVGYHQ
jgi:hypothetical protein